MGSVNIPHAIIFPYMAQGHTLPLLDLAKILSEKGLKVTIITTPSNTQQISSKISTKFTNISTHIIPFPTVDDLPQGCESTKDLTSQDQLLPFLRATSMLKEPFEFFLREVVKNKGHPICVVCDFFLGWAMPICSSLNIPGILFYGMGVLPSVISNLAILHGEHIKSLSNGEEFRSLHGFTSPFPLVREDFPHLIDDHNPFFRYLIEKGDGGASSTCLGALVNSFDDLEGEFVRALESSYGRPDVKVWCVGPLCLYDHQENNAKSLIYDNSSQSCDSNDSCLSWLDKQAEDTLGSVIYVSFGTQSHISNSQMDEIALGLEMSGYRFIWVVRSACWYPPEGWEERVRGRGLIIKEWVAQRRILAHCAIGGFLSHCGWNSVLESLCMGVPLLAWPMGAEQSLNAKVVADYLNIGFKVSRNKEEENKENVILGRDVISSALKKLMGQKSGRLTRQRAEQVGKMARKAVEKDGSSSKKLDQLIKYLVELN